MPFATTISTKIPNMQDIMRITLSKNPLFHPHITPMPKIAITIISVDYKKYIDIQFRSTSAVKFCILLLKLY